MNTQERRNMSVILGRRCAAWIREPDKDPVRVEVLARDASEVSMRAFHNDRQYFLYLDLAGAGQHHCTCRDFRPWGMFSRKGLVADLFCRHIVAAALKENRLELLLSLLTQRL